MIFEQLKIGSMENFCYIIGDEDTHTAAVVDPHGDIDRILALVESRGLRVKYIINTHTHWDHVAGNEELKRRTGAQVVTHREGRVPRDIEVDNGDVISLGNLEIRVLHTPGHSPDSICLLVDKKVLTGDTLFVGECGRTDLPGGDAGKMYHSLFDVLSRLDDHVEVYPGHDYGPKPSSTIGHEKRHNYTLEPRSKEDFIRFMAEP
jgi:glyoxylase-like metal-dependent hydrolase (beta-lactamase superfamily II)